MILKIIGEFDKASGESMSGEIKKEEEKNCKIQVETLLRKSLDEKEAKKGKRREI